MKVKQVSKEGGKIEFEVSGASPALMSVLRQAIMADVPTMGIEFVDIRENSSALYNEILAHRLGLIPLSFTEKDYALPEECKCEGKGCAECTATLVLEKDGPCMVHAKDLKSSNPKVKPSDEDILIVKLLENQSVKLEARAQLGRGRDHAKWTPAVVGFKYFPSLSVSKECDKCGKCVKACPKEAIDKSIKLSDPYKCDLCSSCAEECPKGALKVVGDDTRFVMTVDSTSGISSREIVLKALDIVSEELKAMENEAKELK